MADRKLTQMLLLELLLELLLLLLLLLLPLLLLHVFNHVLIRGREAPPYNYVINTCSRRSSRSSSRSSSNSSSSSSSSSICVNFILIYLVFQDTKYSVRILSIHLSPFTSNLFSLSASHLVSHRSIGLSLKNLFFRQPPKPIIVWANLCGCTPRMPPGPSMTWSRSRPECGEKSR